MPRYLDPKADVTFKKIFGEHPKLLQNFLNALLPLSKEEQIVSLEYLSTEQVPQIPTFKRSIVDVKCTDAQDRIFIVEMQMEWTLGFMQRLLFGAAQAYVTQLKQGEDYTALCPVYGIGLVNDVFDRTTQEWYHHYKIVNVQDSKKQLKGLELLFLELPKFKPVNLEEKRLQVLWIRFLSEIGEKTKNVDPELLTVPEIEEACALCEQGAYTEAELATYNTYWDEVRTVKTLVSGKRQEGREEGVKETIKQLLSYGFEPPRIAAATGIPLSEIEALGKECFTAI